ncbi:ABC transporter permease [Chloroflexota bacterium]
MNNLRGVYTIWYRDLLRFWHDKLRMVSSITMPLLFLFVFGSGLSSQIGLMDGEVDFAQFIFPGIVGMTVLMTAFMSGVSVVWDREFGFLKEVLVAPISRVSVALGKTLGAATIALFQGLIILLLAPVIGVELSILKILTLVPLLLFLAATMGSLGIFLATRIKSMEAFQATTQMLMFPMAFLSGVFFPLEGLPVWMSVLVKLNPATYGITPVRMVVLGDAGGGAFGITLFGHTLSVWENIGIMAVFGTAMIILAMWSFNNQE